MKDSPLTRLAAEGRPGAVHTPAEILQQPRLWRDTASRAERARSGIRRVIDDAAYILFSGAGSSLYTGRMIEAAAREEFGGQVASVSATDLMKAPWKYLPDDPNPLLVSLSRSGESPEVVEAARRFADHAMGPGSAAITCNPSSALARVMAEQPGSLLFLLDEAAYDKGMAMTSSVTCMTLAGRCMVEPALPARVEALARAAEALLADHAATAEAAASRDPERIVFLGSEGYEAAAWEGALKVLEMTDGQVATLARSFLEFRHGPLSFVNARTTVVCFLSPVQAIRRYELDLVREVARSGAAMELILVGTDLPKEGQRAVETREADPLLAVVFAQMLALFVTLRRGLTPDLPGTRGLINRIVKGVTVYPADEGERS